MRLFRGGVVGGAAPWKAEPDRFAATPRRRGRLAARRAPPGARRWGTEARERGVTLDRPHDRRGDDRRRRVQRNVAVRKELDVAVAPWRRRSTVPPLRAERFAVRIRAPPSSAWWRATRRQTTPRRRGRRETVRIPLPGGSASDDAATKEPHPLRRLVTRSAYRCASSSSLAGSGARFRLWRIMPRTRSSYACS